MAKLERKSDFLGAAVNHLNKGWVYEDVKKVGKGVETEITSGGT